jgi:hypothetical protein
MDFWKDQKGNMKHLKQLEKETYLSPGFSERNTFDSSSLLKTKAEKNVQSILNESRNNIGNGHKNHSGNLINSTLDGINITQKSRLKLNEQRIHNPINNPTNESLEILSKNKSTYMKQLNVQLAEQTTRKQFDNHMNPREKQINMKYLMDLSSKNGVANNPILNSGGYQNRSVII